MQMLLVTHCYPEARNICGGLLRQTCGTVGTTASVRKAEFATQLRSTKYRIFKWYCAPVVLRVLDIDGASYKDSSWIVDSSARERPRQAKLAHAIACAIDASGSKHNSVTSRTKCAATKKCIATHLYYYLLLSMNASGQSEHACLNISEYAQRPKRQ